MKIKRILHKLFFCFAILPSMTCNTVSCAAKITQNEIISTNDKRQTTNDEGKAIYQFEINALPKNNNLTIELLGDNTNNLNFLHQINVNSNNFEIEVEVKDKEEDFQTNFDISFLYINSNNKHATQSISNFGINYKCNDSAIVYDGPKTIDTSYTQGSAEFNDFKVRSSPKDNKIHITPKGDNIDLIKCNTIANVDNNNFNLDVSIKNLEHETDVLFDLELTYTNKWGIEITKIINGFEVRYNPTSSDPIIYNGQKTIDASNTSGVAMYTGFRTASQPIDNKIYVFIIGDYCNLITTSREIYFTNNTFDLKISINDINQMYNVPFNLKFIFININNQMISYVIQGFKIRYTSSYDQIIYDGIKSIDASETGVATFDTFTTQSIPKDNKIYIYPIGDYADMIHTSPFISIDENKFILNIYIKDFAEKAYDILFDLKFVYTNVTGIEITSTITGFEICINQITYEGDSIVSADKYGIATYGNFKILNAPINEKIYLHLSGESAKLISVPDTIQSVSVGFDLKATIKDFNEEETYEITFDLIINYTNQYWNIIEKKFYNLTIKYDPSNMLSYDGKKIIDTVDSHCEAAFQNFETPFQPTNDQIHISLSGTRASQLKILNGKFEEFDYIVNVKNKKFDLIIIIVDGIESQNYNIPFTINYWYINHEKAIRDLSLDGFVILNTPSDKKIITYDNNKTQYANNHGIASYNGFITRTQPYDDNVCASIQGEYANKLKINQITNVVDKTFNLNIQIDDDLEINHDIIFSIKFEYNTTWPFTSICTIDNFEIKYVPPSSDKIIYNNDKIVDTSNSDGIALFTDFKIRSILKITEISITLTGSQSNLIATSTNTVIATNNIFSLNVYIQNKQEIDYNIEFGIEFLYHSIDGDLKYKIDNFRILYLPTINKTQPIK